MMKLGDVCTKDSDCNKGHCKNTPDFVDDSEIVIRALLEPRHVNLATRRITVGAFSRKYLEERGVSVDRLSKTTKEDYKNHIKYLETNFFHKPVAAYAVCEASTVRSIFDKILFLCPSSRPNNASHADIYTKHCINIEDFDELRRELANNFRIIESVESSFS